MGELETVTILSQREKYDISTLGRIGCDVVLGVEQEGKPPLMMQEGHDLFDRPRRPGLRRTELTLARNCVQRFVDAYTRLFVDNEPVDYDCATFAYHVIAGEALDSNAMHGERYGIDEQGVSHNALEEGEVYSFIRYIPAMTQREEVFKPLHMVIGSANPRYHLGVMGLRSLGGGLLVYAPNMQIMDGYGAWSVGRIRPKDNQPLADYAFYAQQRAL